MLYKPVVAWGKVVLICRHDAMLHCVTAALTTVVLTDVRLATEHTVQGVA